MSQKHVFVLNTALKLTFDEESLFGTLLFCTESPQYLRRKINQ